MRVARLITAVIIFIIVGTIAAWSIHYLWQWGV